MDVRIASTATTSSLGMPSLALTKRPESAFLAILASVSDEEVSGDELADTSSHTNADTQMASPMEIPQKYAALESAGGDHRVSATSSGDQRRASDDVSFNVRANRLTIDYAASDVANGKPGPALSDGRNETTAVKATVIDPSSQRWAHASPSSVVVHPMPANEGMEPIATRASLESRTRPLTDETNAPVASAAKVSVPSLQPSAQVNPSSVVVHPTPATELAKAAPALAVMKAATGPFTAGTDVLKASAGKLSFSSSQPSAQSSPPTVVVHPMPATELAKAASARALMEAATRPLIDVTNAIVVSVAKVSVPSSQPSAEISPRPNPIPITFARPSSEKFPRARLIANGTMAHADEPSVAISSLKNVSSSSPQTPAQNTHSRETFQRTLVTVSAQEFAKSGPTKTGSKSNTEEADMLIPPANGVGIAPAQLAVKINSSRLNPQPYIAATPGKAASGASLKDTDANTQADELTALNPSANTVPIVPAQLAAQTSSSRPTSQLSFAAIPEQAAFGISLKEADTNTHADELTAPGPSANTAPIAPALFAVQTSSSRPTSQSFFSATREQAASGTSLKETDTKTDTDELTRPTSSANRVPIAPVQLAAQTISSRPSSQLFFSATPEQAASGANLKATDTETQPDELTAPGFSVVNVSAISSQVSVLSNSPREVLQGSFSATPEPAASAISSIKTEAKMRTQEPNVLVVSQTASPSPLSLPSAPASSSGNPIQQTLASAPAEEIPVSGLKNTDVNAHVETSVEHVDANPPMDTSVIDASSNGGVNTTASEPAVNRDKAQADQSLSVPGNVALKDNGLSADRAGDESGHAIPAELDVPARVTVPRIAQEIAAPEDIAKPLKLSSATAPRIPAADIPTANNKVQKSTTAVVSEQTDIEKSVAVLFAESAFTGSLNLSTASTPADNGNGIQVLPGPVKKESSIAGAAGNSVLANTADTGTKQSTATVSRAEDGSTHATQNDLPPSQSLPADPSHATEGAPKASDGGPVQPSSAQAQAVAVHTTIPEPARADRTATTLDAAHLPAERQEVPTSIHGDAGEALATSSINTAKLMQTMGESEMHIGMHSTEFGEISIRTSIAQQQMVAQISLDHSGLSQAISAHVSTMQTRLGEDYGINASIEIHNLGSPLSGDPGQSSQREQKAFAGSAQTNSAPLPQTEETSLSLAALVTPGIGDRLDIRA